MSPPLTILQGESASGQPTPFHTRPHPRQGVSFENVQNQAEMIGGTLLNMPHVIFPESNHPQPNPPPGDFTPF